MNSLTRGACTNIKFIVQTNYQYKSSIVTSTIRQLKDKVKNSTFMSFALEVQGTQSWSFETYS